MRGVKGSCVTDTERRCHVCATWKSKDAFAKSRREIDGRQARCRDCTAEYRRNNRPQAAETARRHRATPKSRETVATWREKHRDRRRVQQKAYYEQNRDRWRDYVQQRQALIFHPGAEKVQRQLVWIRDQGICRLCRLDADPRDWHLEHLVPLSRGGEHTYENTAVAHPACNQSKSAMTLEEWMRR